MYCWIWMRLEAKLISHQMPHMFYPYASELVIFTFKKKVICMFLIFMNYWLNLKSFCFYYWYITGFFLRGGLGKMWICNNFGMWWFSGFVDWVEGWNKRKELKQIWRTINFWCSVVLRIARKRKYYLFLEVEKKIFKTCLAAHFFEVCL